jgi:glutathione S-transferase
MITLHYDPGSASFAPHVLLNEIGTPFELRLVDRERQAHKAPDYLAMNPNGLIPVLIDGDLVLYETVAILLHLADTHPDAQLAPAIATPQRAQYYKWLVWMTNTLQATLIHYFYAHRMVEPGNEAGAAQVKAQAEIKVGACLAQIDAQLARHGGPWLLGESYSAADPMAFMLGRWTRNFQHSRPARDYAHIGPYMRRVFERPALAKAMATEQLQPIY